MKSKILTLLGLCLTITTPSLYSQTYHNWVGTGANSDWSLGSNWDLGSAPTTGSNVLIQSSTGPIIVDGNNLFSMNYRLEVDFGGVLVVNGGSIGTSNTIISDNSKLTVNGGIFSALNGNCSVTGSSTLNLTGGALSSDWLVFELDSTGNLSGGIVTVSSFSVVNGANVTVGTDVFSHTLDIAGNGTLVVDGGYIDLSADIWIDGNSILSLKNEAIIRSAAGTLSAYNATTLSMDLTSMLMLDTLDMSSGDISLVILDNGDSFVGGETFVLFEIDSIVGTFADVDLFGLAAGLSWNLDNLYTNGTISIDGYVIPEPSTYALIFGALALGLAIYRRRK